MRVSPSPAATGAGQVGAATTANRSAGSAVAPVNEIDAPPVLASVSVVVVPAATSSALGEATTTSTPPLQPALVQVPPATQGLTSSQDVPSIAHASGGHAVDVPEHTSITSQTAASSRQMVPAEAS